MVSTLSFAQNSHISLHYLAFVSSTWSALVLTVQGQEVVMPKKTPLGRAHWQRERILFALAVDGKGCLHQAGSYFVLFRMLIRTRNRI